MLRLPRYSAAAGMFLLERTDEFDAALRKRVASILLRVLESKKSILAATAYSCDFSIRRIGSQLLSSLDIIKISRYIIR